MNKSTGKKILKTGRKTVMVTFRCTEELKNKIETKAGQMKIRESKFLSECVEVGLKRQSRYDKGKVRSLVEMQEAMNRMVTGYDGEQDEIKEQILKLMERGIELWQI